MTIHRFAFRNDSEDALSLNIEPEGALFALPPGEEVTIADDFLQAPMALRFSRDPAGEPVISIWPGDGDLRVTKDGIDVLELVGQDALAGANA